MGEAARGYERDAERLCARIAALNLEAWSGRGRGADPGSAYRSHRRLLSDRSAAELRRRADPGPGAAPEARRAAALLAFVAESRVGRARLEVDREIARVQTTALITGAGAAVPLTGYRAALAAEPDPERRANLIAARAALLAERLDPLLIEARGRGRAELAELGFGSEAELTEATTAIDLAALAAAAEDFLARTGTVLGAALESAAALAGMTGELRSGGDLVRLLRVLADAGGPPPGLADTYAAILGGLGLGLGTEATKRIVTDLDPRPGKSPRAFCAPLRVPGEVHLVLAPGGGWEDLADLLHEAGHALHFAHADPALPTSERRLGDRSVGEGWAFLLEGLAAEPAWLRGLEPDGDPSGPAFAARLRALVTARRYCALLLHELELDASADPIAERSRIRERYTELQRRGSGLAADPGGWLYDPDPGLQSARYLRGWMLAASIRAALRERFGPDWFASAAAGDWLAAAWGRAQREDAAELARELGCERLGFAALERDARELPAGPKPLGSPPGAGRL